MRRKIIIILSVLILLVFIGLAAAISWPSRARTDTVRIVPEMTLREIANKISGKDLIRSARLFIFLTKITGNEKRLKAGLYEIPAKSSPYQILQKLAQGKTAVIRVTIPEGWSSWEIAKTLEQKELCQSEEFINLVIQKRLEGFLFPNTYLIPSEFSVEAIALTFSKEFEKTWEPEWEITARRLGLSKEDAVTLASIIEREAQYDAEKPIISSVFHNRLRRKMPLEADPTVLYGLGSWNVPLTRQLLRTKSPYNTYLYRGLPPGPICNPGEKAILAAVFPAKTDYLFFVSNGDGTHTFSKTLAGQNAAIKEARTRKILEELKNGEDGERTGSNTE